MKMVKRFCFSIILTLSAMFYVIPILGMDDVSLALEDYVSFDGYEYCWPLNSDFSHIFHSENPNIEKGKVIDYTDNLIGKLQVKYCWVKYNNSTIGIRDEINKKEVKFSYKSDFLDAFYMKSKISNDKKYLALWIKGSFLRVFELKPKLREVIISQNDCPLNIHDCKFNDNNTKLIIYSFVNNTDWKIKEAYKIDMVKSVLKNNDGSMRLCMYFYKDNAKRLKDLINKKTITISKKEEVYSGLKYKLNKNNKYFSVSAGKKIAVYDLNEESKLIGKIKTNFLIKNYKFSSNNKYIFVNTTETDKLNEIKNRIHAFLFENEELNKKVVSRTYHLENNVKYQCSKDEKYLLILEQKNNDHFVKVFNIDSGKYVFYSEYKDNINIYSLINYNGNTCLLLNFYNDKKSEWKNEILIVNLEQKSKELLPYQNLFHKWFDSKIKTFKIIQSKILNVKFEDDTIKKFDLSISKEINKLKVNEKKRKRKQKTKDDKEIKEPKRKRRRISFEEEENN